MIALLAALVLGPVQEPTFTNTVVIGEFVSPFRPVADVWAYPHAADPTTDPYLRVWGAGGVDVAANASDAENLSYSYLVFDLPKDGKTPKAARLTLWQTPNPAYTLDQAKAAPIQVRALSADFDEKAWRYDLIATVFPTGEPFATGAPEALAPAGEPTKIVIVFAPKDGAPDFRPYFAKGGRVGLALTTKLDVSAGDRLTYRLSSKDAEKEALRPLLELVY